MKKYTKTILALALSAAAIVSCSKTSISNAPTFFTDEIRFADGGISSYTKAFTEVTNETLQTNGFNVAAIKDDDNSIIFNRAVSYRNGAYSVSEEHYYWPKAGTTSFYSVYPKTQLIDVSSKGVATLSYCQNPDTDLIAAKATGILEQSDPVMMNFSHLLSQMRIKVRGDDPLVDFKLYKFTVTAIDGGTYAYADGTWTLGSNAQTYSIYDDVSGMAISSDELTDIGSAMSFLPGKVKIDVEWKCYEKGTSTVLTERNFTVDVELIQGKSVTLNFILSYDVSFLSVSSTLNEWVNKINDVSTKNFIFTVNDSGKKVKFSPGNLYWNGTEFKFEEHQYDRIAKLDANHVANFYWSKDARVARSTNYYVAANEEFAITPKTNDKFFAVDGGAIEGWTVLTATEWRYVLANAKEKESKVNGNNSLILKPDGFSGTVADSYTAEEWAAAELAYGLVALPCICYRTGENFNPISYHEYWSSTPTAGDVEKASGMDDFNGAGTLGIYDRKRSYGYAIRLVQVVQ